MREKIVFIVGLTGGIGSGKSTVATLFAKQGVPIIDADVIAKEITTPDKPAFSQIVNHFGRNVVMANGRLDRSKLRRIIFRDPTQRFWLEQLLHPLIRKELKAQLDRITAPYCIAVIPLLLETEFYSFINRILVIDAPEPEQIQRVMQRDKTSKTDIEAVLRNQADRKARKLKAHDIITNDGPLANLLPQVDRLHKMYTSMAG